MLQYLISLFCIAHCKNVVYILTVLKVLHFYFNITMLQTKLRTTTSSGWKPTREQPAISHGKVLIAGVGGGQSRDERRKLNEIGDTFLLVSFSRSARCFITNLYREIATQL
jgi:hypothetical protein